METATLKPLSRASLGLVVAVACSGCQPARVTSAPEPRPSAAVVVDAAVARSTPSVPHLHPLLSDPRLARVHTLAADHDWVGAVAAMAEATASLSPDPRTPIERCGWSYVAGRLLLAAGQSKDAALAFDAARDPACGLAPYATLHAAEAYLRAGDAVSAESRAAAVEPESVVHDDAELVLASALSLLGRSSEAIPKWRAALAKSPKVWIDVALPLATALLDRASKGSDPDVEEALALATRVVVEAPRIAESSGAEALRRRAALRAGHDARGSAELTLHEKTAEARAWLDAGEPKKALALVTAVLADPRVAKEAEVSCNASVIRAQALGRTRGALGTAWDDAIARCEHDPSLVTALYAGAKAVSGKQPDVARARYARVEALFHDHRLADDARFQGALLALGAGDEPSFTKMMLSLPDDYPAGDQRTEALFRVALLRMTRGDWAGAAPVLDRIDALAPDDQHWATAGRAEYFRARAAAALGQRDDAAARYARVLDRHPFAYYMTQAYARLSEVDPAVASRALAAAFAREESAPFVVREHAELASPAFARARTLLELGDVDLARRELAAAGATREGVDPEVGWTVALLYDEAGAPEIGHAMARRELKDYLGHYPVSAWKTKWEIAYPRAFDDLVVRDSAESGIPTALTWAIMREESDFVADARSSSNAFGLMQLIVPTARGVARGTGLGSDEAALKEPKVNVALGTRLLGQLRGSFKDNPTLAVAAYNGGGGAVSRWLSARGGEPFDLWVEEIPWDETRGYEKRVLSSEAAYAFLYDPPALDEVLRIAATASGPRTERSTPR